MRRFRFSLALLCVAGGTFVLAEPQFQRPVPSVRVPEVRVPSIPTPRIGTVPQPRAAAQSIPVPVMSPELTQAHLEAASRGLDYLPGRVLVKFRPGAGMPEQARALSAIGNERPFSGLEWTGEFAIVKDTSGVDPRELASRLRQQPEVEYAQPDYLLKLHSTPNDPNFGARQWNLSLLNMPRAWDVEPGGSTDLIVAVVDTGITTLPPQSMAVQTWNGSAIVTHQLQIGHSPDFTPGRFVLSRDFIVSTTAPPSLVIDTDGHGTHVAGTIGEDTNNGIFLAGMAYNVRIMPLKACRSFWDLQFAMSAAGTPGRPPAGTTTGCPSSATSAAIRFAADNGARVLNYSIGGNSPNTVVRDAIAYAVSKGVFISVSNGNDFEDGNPTTYPASYGPGIEGMMAVGAVNRAISKSYYSSTGSWTEISAPGGDSRQGNTIWQMSIRASDASTFLFFPRFDRYDERGFQGTSMAAPHVAGLAALLMSRGHTDPAIVEAIIKQTAQDIGVAGRDDSFGDGMIQPFRALFGRGLRR